MYSNAIVIFCQHIIKLYKTNKKNCLHEGKKQISLSYITTIHIV